jgi:D-lyxose ketol-isomerase
MHSFEAGDDGAIVSEFSTTSHDALDVFTDPRIVR